MAINYKQKLFIRKSWEGQFRTICLPCDARPAEGVRVFVVRSRDINNEQVFLQEVDRMEAGHGYVFLSERRRAVFYSEGEWVDASVRDEPLTGTFTPCPQLHPHQFLLYDNAWYYAGNSLSIEGRRQCARNIYQHLHC